MPQRSVRPRGVAIGAAHGLSHRHFHANRTGNGLLQQMVEIELTHFTLHAVRSSDREFVMWEETRAGAPRLPKLNLRPV